LSKAAIGPSTETGRETATWPNARRYQWPKRVAITASGDIAVAVAVAVVVVVVVVVVN